MLRNTTKNKSYGKHFHFNIRKFAMFRRDFNFVCFTFNTSIYSQLEIIPEYNTQH